MLHQPLRDAHWSSRFHLAASHKKLPWRLKKRKKKDVFRGLDENNNNHSSKADRCEEKNVVLISVAAALGLPYGSVSSPSPSHGNTVTPAVHTGLRPYRKHSTQPYWSQFNLFKSLFFGVTVHVDRPAEPPHFLSCRDERKCLYSLLCPWLWWKLASCSVCQVNVCVRAHVCDDWRGTVKDC